MNMTWKTFSVEDGFKHIRLDPKLIKRGSVIVAFGPRDVKHYTFRKTRDGRFMTSRGPLASATASYLDGEMMSVVFNIEGL